MRLVYQAIFPQAADHFLPVIAGFVGWDALDPLVVVPGILRVPSANGLLTRVVGGDRLENVATEHFEQASQVGRADFHAERRVVEIEWRPSRACGQSKAARGRRQELHQAPRVRTRACLRIEETLLVN